VKLGEWSVEGLGRAPQNITQLPPEQDFDVDEEDFIIHEDYVRSFDSILNDIALIKLPRPARLNKGVQMVCLPHNLAEFRHELGLENGGTELYGWNATVVGWGFKGYDPYADSPQGDVDEFGVGSKQQQKLVVPVLSPSICKAKGEGFDVRENQVCAGGEIGKDSCKGDSGGGLFVQRPKDPRADIGRKASRPWYLLGIVSSGSKFCGDGSPGIYTRVSHFIPWIIEQVGRN